MSLFVFPLISLLGIYSALPTEVKTSAKERAFSVPVSGLKAETKTLYHRGLPLDAGPSSMKCPETLSCLSFDPVDATVSLARLNTGQFEKIADLEICLQRAGNKLNDLSIVEPWLRTIGFGLAEERPASYWLAANALGMAAKDVAVFRVQWRDEDSLIGQSYLLSRKHNWTSGFVAENLALTLAFSRRDMPVISVRAILIFVEKWEWENASNVRFLSSISTNIGHGDFL